MSRKKRPKPKIVKTYWRAMQAQRGRVREEAKKRWEERYTRAGPKTFFYRPGGYYVSEEKALGYLARGQSIAARYYEKEIWKQRKADAVESLVEAGLSRKFAERESNRILRNIRADITGAKRMQWRWTQKFDAKGRRIWKSVKPDPKTGKHIYKPSPNAIRSMKVQSYHAIIRVYCAHFGVSYKEARKMYKERKEEFEHTRLVVTP